MSKTTNPNVGGKEITKAIQDELDSLVYPQIELALPFIERSGQLDSLKFNNPNSKTLDLTLSLPTWIGPQILPFRKDLVRRWMGTVYKTPTDQFANPIIESVWAKDSEYSFSLAVSFKSVEVLPSPVPAVLMQLIAAYIRVYGDMQQHFESESDSTTNLTE